MAENVVRLLSLDSMGTLFNVDGGLTEALQVAGVPQATGVARLWVEGVRSASQALQEPELFQPFPHLVASALDAILGDPLSIPTALSDHARADLLSAWQNLPVFPDVKPALQQWRDLGQTAWIVTNGDMDGIEALLERHGLQELVGGVVTAGAVRRYKPSRELYLRAASSAGVIPAQVVMASALPYDVKGAMQAGFRGAYLQREGAPTNSDGFEPTWKFRTLQELIEALQPLLQRPETGQSVY